MPWDLVFERARYNQQPPFSPLYLAAVPAVALAGLRLARVRGLLLIAGLFSLLFLWLPPDGRYLVPILPLASLAVAGSVSAAVERWQGFARRRLLAALALLCFLPGWLYAGYRVARQGPPPLTATAREDYLARRLPVYPAIAALNRERGSGYVLWAWRAENMAYFADGRFLGDWFGPASFPRVQAAAPEAESLHRELRRWGATHLLLPARGLDGREIAPPVPEDEAFRRWFALVYRDPHARVYALRAVGDHPHSRSPRSMPRIIARHRSISRSVSGLKLPSRRSSRERATARTPRQTAALSASTPSSGDTCGRRGEGARELETGTTTNNSSSRPARSGSTDTTIAGRFLPGSPRRAAPRETSHTSPLRGSGSAIAEGPLPVPFLGAHRGVTGIRTRGVAFGAEDCLSRGATSELGKHRRQRYPTLARLTGQEVPRLACDPDCRRLGSHELKLAHGAMKWRYSRARIR
jgi:hypothetical protein